MKDSTEHPSQNHPAALALVTAVRRPHGARDTVLFACFPPAV
jgi:hypothetical protein